jgi:hypothetical protein
MKIRIFYGRTACMSFVSGRYFGGTFYFLHQDYVVEFFSKYDIRELYNLKKEAEYSSEISVRVYSKQSIQRHIRDDSNVRFLFW